MRRQPTAGVNCLHGPTPPNHRPGVQSDVPARRILVGVDQGALEHGACATLEAVEVAHAAR